MYQPITLHKRIGAFSLTILLALLSLSGCAVKLISSYDEVTDRQVTALQKKTEMHLMALESVEGLPECKHEKYKQFYLDARVDASAIEVRAAAIPQNEITAEQVHLLASSLETLEKLHKLSCLSKDQIKTLRTQFNSSFTAILKLELAKRRVP